ncbi:hypothetical protein EG329_008894 [Mollisiaceae sp. DMI_Dod_QoI]|nr:hypothetical protein EG329_008894 [Helotiales sp. DMI_Dod_QoI]
MEAPFRFNDLPPELRLRIWYFSMPGPRLVPVHYDHDQRRYQARINPPAVLQVNRESRLEGLKWYYQIRLGPHQNFGCYVDSSLDTVYLTSNIRAYARLDQSFNLNEFLDLQSFGSNELFHDMLTSPDFGALLQNLTVGAKTWRALHFCVLRMRSVRFMDLHSVRAVYEKGSGLLDEKMKLHDFKIPLNGQDGPIALWLDYKYPDKHCRYRAAYECLIRASADKYKKWVRDSNAAYEEDEHEVRYEFSQQYIDRRGMEIYKAL